MSTKHTPGPWTLTTVPTSSGLCHKIGPFPYKQGRDNHACVYVDYPSCGGEMEAELEANARLMATAPELLAALIAAESAMEHMGETLNGMDVVQEEDSVHFPAFGMVRAAIAKAVPPAEKEGD